MQLTPRALIVDDDPHAAEYLKFQLQRVVPNIHTEIRQEPDITGQFDMYFLDNDFSGSRFAAELASRIRQHRPDSLIIIFSAFLDAETLKRLLHAGCDGVCEKQEQAETRELLTMVQRFAQTMQRRHTQSKPSRGLVAVVQSIAELLREWNLRLNYRDRELYQDKNPLVKHNGG